MHLRPGASVGEIAASAHEAARLFDTLGIDYVCHGNLSLGDACAELHLDPADVERALRRLEPERRAGEDRSRPVATVIHELVTAEFPAIRYRIERAASVVSDVCALDVGSPATAGVRDAFDDLASRIGDHLHREETDLFPRLRDCAGAPRAELARQLAAVVAEHFAITAAVASLGTSVGEVEKVKPSAARLRAVLRALEAELRRHIHVENNILFPQVLPAATRASG